MFHMKHFCTTQPYKTPIHQNNKRPLFHMKHFIAKKYLHKHCPKSKQTVSHETFYAKLPFS